MDTVTIVFVIVGVYLVTGILAVVLLDILTGRVRERIKGASVETQTLTGDSPKVAFVVTVLALWLLWPVAIYAAIRR